MDLESKNDKSVEEEVRNALLPLAVAKPSILKKVCILSLIVFYFMLVIGYLTNGFFINYIYIEIGQIMLLFFVSSKIYDYLYRCSLENTMNDYYMGALIHFSNKVLILQGENLIEQYDTDEIRIRSANEDEKEQFFPNHTSVLECIKDGELVCKIGIGKVEEYENLVLKPDLSRIDEDPKIGIDDEDNEDNEDEDDRDDDFEE